MTFHNWRDFMKKLLVILSLICLFSSAFAVEASTNMPQSEIIQIMAEIEPYMKLNADKTVRFNIASAKGTLSEQSVEVGKVYERFHNSTMKAVMNNQKSFQSQQDKEDLKIFEPFFLAVQKTGALTTNDLINATSNDSTNEIVPKGSLKLQNLSSINFSSKSSMKTISLACNGGGPTSPAYCPPWKYPTQTFSTKGKAVNFLLGQGYHKTNSVGCGYSTCPDDYTKPIFANSCNLGVFRTQGIVYASGSSWKYRYQTPEPNPEIFSYTWPAAVWWGPYVAWWHVSYCN